MKAALLALGCLVLVGCNDAQSPAGSSKPVTNPPTRTADKGAVDRDNTAVNVRDRDPVAKTPIDQNENKEDIRITADIRKRVTDTKMSVDAQNVKIITQDGRVTLRGPVKSDEERNAIEEIATDVAGADHVTNELEVSN